MLVLQMRWCTTLVKTIILSNEDPTLMKMPELGITLLQLLQLGSGPLITLSTPLILAIYSFCLHTAGFGTFLLWCSLG